MAIRLRSTLKQWFKRGKYPLEEQFADWIDSFLHKTEDTLPLANVEGLPEQLNAKYDHASGVALEKNHQALRTEFDQHVATSDLEFERISEDLDELEAEDERLDGCITSETERATREETVIRKEFAAADLAEKNRAVGEETAIREEFAAASAKSYTDTKDTQVRNDFAAADAKLREALEAETERATGEEAVIRKEFAAADLAEKNRAVGEETAIREEFAAADAEALTAAKDYTDTRETAIRSDMTSGDAKTLADAKKHAESKIAELVNSAPATLDTLNELAEALGNDPNFASTVAEQIGGKVDKVDGKGLSTNDYTTDEKKKLAGIASGANNYTHPTNHPATMIAEDTTHRFITDNERKVWNAKADTQHKHVMSDITDMNDNIVDGSTIRHIKGPISISEYNLLVDKRDDTLYIIY